MLSEGRAFSDWATDAEDAVLASAAAASVDGYSSHDRWSSRASRCCRRSIISSSGCSALPSKRLLRRRCTGARVSPGPARPGHRKLVRRCCPCLRDALAAAAASSLAWFRIAVIWHFSHNGSRPQLSAPTELTEWGSWRIEPQTVGQTRNNSVIYSVNSQILTNCWHKCADFTLFYSVTILTKHSLRTVAQRFSGGIFSEGECSRISICCGLLTAIMIILHCVQPS